MTWGVTTTNFTCTVVTSDWKVKWGGGVLLHWWFTIRWWRGRQIMISVRYTTLFEIPELSVKCVNVEWSQYGLWLLTRSKRFKKKKEKKKLYWHVLHCTEETMWWSCGAAWYCWERGGQAEYRKSLNHWCNTFFSLFLFLKTIRDPKCPMASLEMSQFDANRLEQPSSRTVCHNSERYCVKYLYGVQSRDYMNVSKVLQWKKSFIIYVFTVQWHKNKHWWICFLRVISLVDFHVQLWWFKLVIFSK